MGFFLSLVSLPEAVTANEAEGEAVDTGHEDSDVIYPRLKIGLSLALGILGFSIAVILVALRFLYIKKRRNDNVSVCHCTGTISSNK